MSKLLLFIYVNLNKFLIIQAAPLRPLNIWAAAFAKFEASFRVYTNKNMQSILRALIEARLTAAKFSYKRFFKARFSDLWKSDNHITCYNFCQQCKDHFATAGAKKPNHISFTIFFIQDCINFC